MKEVTTPELIKGIERTFGKITVDLAATAEDTVAPDFITPEENTFNVDWTKRIGQGLGYLNPPPPKSLDDRCEWMEKCDREARQGAAFLVLVPAEIDSYWYWEYVQPWAISYILYPRMAYQGVETPLMLCAANYSHKDIEPFDFREMYLWNWMIGKIK